MQSEASAIPGRSQRILESVTDLRPEKCRVVRGGYVEEKRMMLLKYTLIFIVVANEIRFGFLFFFKKYKSLNCTS